ncbi:hypothetical protein CFP56_023189 [Quercus suber]|uniref:Uncharacterized protein n=1 Tax=Quercus suber TaxID=58331 RepID=A0AAW0LZ83_QUESU
MKYFSTVYKLGESRIGIASRRRTIDKFRVLFDMDETFTSEIDNWLLSSLKKRVKKLSLYFKSIWHRYSNFYTLTSQFLHVGKFLTMFYLIAHPLKDYAWGAQTLY